MTPSFKRLVAAVAIIAVVLPLAACQPPPPIFEKPGATLQEFSADKLRCQAISRGMDGSSVAFGSPMFVAIAAAAANKRQQGYFETCMQAEGYSIMPTQYGASR